MEWCFGIFNWFSVALSALLAACCFRSLLFATLRFHFWAILLILPPNGMLKLAFVCGMQRALLLVVDEHVLIEAGGILSVDTDVLEVMTVMSSSSYASSSYVGWLLFLRLDFIV